MDTVPFILGVFISLTIYQVTGTAQNIDLMHSPDVSSKLIIKVRLLNLLSMKILLTVLTWNVNCVKTLNKYPGNCSLFYRDHFLLAL